MHAWGNGIPEDTLTTLMNSNENVRNFGGNDTLELAKCGMNSTDAKVMTNMLRDNTMVTKVSWLCQREKRRNTAFDVQCNILSACLSAFARTRLRNGVFVACVRYYHTDAPVLGCCCALLRAPLCEMHLSNRCMLPGTSCALLEQPLLGTCSRSIPR